MGYVEGTQVAGSKRMINRWNVPIPEVKELGPIILSPGDNLEISFDVHGGGKEIVQVIAAPCPGCGLTTREHDD